ncbi:hypothetical protein B7494_g8455 [Chlorociboria aeruginascens]|nr:hypothetical protein B7494_g8455 [Chlorociboria aeruginascens]
MTSESVRPLLLPQNRKLRHLQGIYLRNLTLTRPRGHTIDDAALNKSPQKLQALREPQLHHAQSSGDLRKQPSTLRRTSSNWSAASPQSRQKKLEDVIDSRMADSFFSLHCEGQEDPLYISEVVEKAMNPSFRFFNLSSFSAAITRLDKITVKFWVKRQDFVILLEEVVDLRALHFIGTLENHQFLPNSVIFHLIDGFYALNISSKPPNPKPAPSLPTSSYSALMRLSNLDESIQDALATREEIANQINEILNKAPVNETPQAQEESLLAARYVSTQQKLLNQSLRRRNDLQASITARSKAIEEGMRAQRDAQADVNNAQEKIRSCQELLKTTSIDMAGQRRRICEELLRIFPIEPTDKPLLFTICGLPLPNSSFDDSEHEDTISAALGYIALLINYLQYYLSIPLPYPIQPFGSRTIIQDFISVLPDKERNFPLWIKGSVRYRFDYAVFLLNKDIEALAEGLGIKVLDIRQTAPNARMVLLAACGGRGEIPGRKKGGVRGLLVDIASQAQSRSASVDSLGDGARRALERGISTAGSMADFPFATQQLSLRTSGLRENVRQ